MTASKLSADRARLLELSHERGTSLSSLSGLLGRNPAYLQQFIKRGTPRKLEEADRRKLSQFFGVDDHELRAAEDKSYTAELTAAQARWIDVPRLDIGASAGPGALPGGEEAFDTVRFSRRWLFEQGLEAGQLSLITVEGDSMEPLLNDGDQILVDRSERPFRDGIHVVRMGETLMVKRVARGQAGRFALLSQNTAYPPIEVNAEECDIIGRVVWKGGRI